jgi:hypothetical protein
MGVFEKRYLRKKIAPDSAVVKKFGVYAKELLGVFT